MKNEILHELHPSTCEHNTCSALFCNNYKEEPIKPIPTIKNEDVYIVPEGQRGPKSLKLDSCLKRSQWLGNNDAYSWEKYIAGEFNPFEPSTE